MIVVRLYVVLWGKSKEMKMISQIFTESRHIQEIPIPIPIPSSSTTITNTSINNIPLVQVLSETIEDEDDDDIEEVFG